MLHSIGSVTVLAVLMVACGGGGGIPSGVDEEQGGTGVSKHAPTDLFYHSGNYQGWIIVWLNVGVPIVLDAPTVTGTVTGYSVSPALPAGVSFSSSTGKISGTPLTAFPETTYTITASNDSGSATTNIDLIVLVPPSALTYASPVTGTVGAPLTRLVPTHGGDADAFAIQPALPAGLDFDPTTGVLSGTPTRARVAATYTIFASNHGGAQTTFDLVLAVGPPPAGTPVIGVFRDSTVIGLGYVSGAQTGVTDASGAFAYESGQGTTFSVGQVTIGTVPVTKALVTPMDLVTNGTGTTNQVLNVVRFLMMLDHDGDPANGIQISAAVTAAAATWTPVDFNTADLPTALGPLIQLASTADGVTHVLPDAATAQARLNADFYCTYAGRYSGTYAEDSAPGNHGHFTAEVLLDGSMRANASGNATLTGFDIVAAHALNPSLDGTFELKSQSPKIDLSGSFFDPTYLSGTYLAAAAGTIEAVSDTWDSASTYKLVGNYTVTPNDPAVAPYTDFVILGMDDSNQVAGKIGGLSLSGTVTDTTFVGKLLDPQPYFPRGYHNVSGTFSNAGSVLTLDGQYENGLATVTFSTVGCRAN